MQPSCLFPVTGPDVLYNVSDSSDISKVAYRFSCKRWFLISGQKTSESYQYKELYESLGEMIVGTYNPSGSHVQVKDIKEAMQNFSDAKAEGIISYGGGAVTDVAKIVSLCIGSNMTAEELVIKIGQISSLDLNCKPYIAIPSTLSGAEFIPTGSCVVHEEKLVFYNQNLLPGIVVLGEKYLHSDLNVLAATGMNALAHAIEALYAPDRNPLSDAYALRGIDLIVEAFSSTELSAHQVKELALAGAWLSALAIRNTSIGLHHITSHIIGGKGGFSHSAVHNIILPNVVTLYEKNIDLILRGSTNIQSTAQLKTKLRQIQENYNLPTSLREISVPKMMLEDIAITLFENPGIKNSPVPLSITQLKQFINGSW